ncbi:MAG: hypothetical protein KC478_17010, partial [Bacteriovoracaceae bacterium]|nr:hypothetical protein [Bacteriovoracaceae bacterium]
RKKLDETFDGRTVVITHHAPSNKCNHREYGLSPFSSGFVSNYNALIKKATLWCYGHTHSNEDLMIEDCRVISNQARYPHETVAGNEYDKTLIIEL